MARADRPNLRLMFDFWHVAVGQGDVIRRLETPLPLIGHVRIAALPSRARSTAARSSPRWNGLATAAGSDANTGRAATPMQGWSAVSFPG